MLPTINTPNATLENPGIINVIVGRNGSGKSKFLRDIDLHFQNDPTVNINILNPERGGSYEYTPTIENNINNDPGWLIRNRQQNQFNDFKRNAINRLRQLSIIWGRRLNDDFALRQTTKTFESEYLDDINKLFLNVKLIWDKLKNTFTFENLAGQPVPANQISSGESEIVALASEILNYFESVDENKQNIFLIDEPDVHLHPDMQARLANFIVKQIDKLSAPKRDRLAVIIATHSTSLATALSSYPGNKIGTKHFGNNIVTPREMPDDFQRTAKFFAHPLSQIIAAEPLFIIEGGDDTRIFQQAARTSQGGIRMFPCEADSVNQQTALERFCNEVLSAIHDHPIAYSIRDGDGRVTPLSPIGCVTRFRLNCYAIENLLLADEFLTSRQSNWGDFQTKALAYAATMPRGRQKNLLVAVANSADRYQHQKIKDIRTLVCVILGSNKPWEFLLGQVIGSLPNILPPPNADHSIINYLGRPLMVAMGFNEPPTAVAVAPVPPAAAAASPTS